ncbi:uroporphyrinogen-III C-methyltransferase [Microlunatus sp. GCM10028923]|uniref:uroporphyrinogen-III C-methyltransferase n=1 Tax=Microlunatus sp. GCM10028923 TaxID=3273400 RepID=UPI00361D60E6
MIGDLDLTGSVVLLIGAESTCRRAERRYRAAGARVRRVGASELPAGDDPVAWRLALLPVAQLPPSRCVIIDGDPGLPSFRVEAVRQHCRRNGVPTVIEPAAEPTGRVTLVGGGPGPEDLLTVAARTALADADVILYDRLAPHDRLAELAPGATLVDVGKRPYHHPVGQDRINELIINYARSGAAVVRLKGGDPYVFGRGGEEVEACRAAGIEVRVVPGVSSAIAVPGAAGIPVTQRGVSRSFTVVSGHEPLGDEDFDALVRVGGTLVIMMGVANLHQLGAGLVRAGLEPDTPAAVIERGLRPGQRTTVGTIGSLPGEAARIGVRSPAVIIVGEVVRAHADLGPLLITAGLGPT